MINRLYTDFKRGLTDVNDVERSGRPNSAVVMENTKKLHKLVLANRKLKLREKAKEMKIWEGSVFPVLHENLSMGKLRSKWVLRLPTDDQKQQRVRDSERYLQLFQRNQKDFLRKHATMDEKWIHHSHPQSQISSQLSEQQQVKAVQSDQRRKHQLASLWLPYFCSSITIKSEYYITLLVRLKKEITKKTTTNKEENVLFH